MAGVCQLAFVWFLVLSGTASAAEILSEVDVVLEKPRLVCGEESLQYWIPNVIHDEKTLRLSAQDKYGKLQPFQNDSSCGLWVNKDYEGSLVICADYRGCYVKMDLDHVMTIYLEQYVKGQWEVLSTEELRCPLDQVMDAPSPSVCSSVQRENRLPCATLSISQEACHQAGCCYDQSDLNTPCYYGNQVTAQCSVDGQLTVAVSKDVTLPQLILSSVRFTRGQGSGCLPVKQNDAFLLFQFPLSDCGTQRKVDGANVVYENDMVADRDVRTWLGASITRDSTLRVHIQCNFAASASLPVRVDVFTLPPPSPASSAGPFMLEMRIAKDTSYRQYYEDGDYPLVKVLREPVFVEVRILHRSDPTINLVLNQCWATTSANPLLQPQWPVLVDRCPFTGDNYQTQLVPIGSSANLAFPSHYERYMMSTFTFVDPSSQQALGGMVYLHCSASACVASLLDSCQASCGTSRRQKRAEDLVLEQNTRSMVTSKGPVYFQMNDTEMPAYKEESSDAAYMLQWSRAVVGVLCVATVALIIVWLWNGHVNVPKPSFNKLYSQDNINQDAKNKFWDNFIIPKIQLDQLLMLNKDISIEEIIQAIQSSVNGKAIGPDQMPIELYKVLQDDIPPILISLYQILNKSFHYNTTEVVKAELLNINIHNFTHCDFVTQNELYSILPISAIWV
ncbi:zona pellucida sperm-binding protein 4-like [Bombina bombina]|uniref:zona pellucida sperm-binding protein 4-like n=1 Tax=Bombina bombina TaxID=8345 RepID=UPI00235A9BBD|nr:zona pellucida sperm-binding protein 4-like [Bombina bombina]